MSYQNTFSNAVEHAEGAFSNCVSTKDIPTGLRESVMNRRRFLGVAAGVAGLSGCVDGIFEPSDVWPEGSSFFTFGSVSDEFSGTLRIVPDCRDDDVT